METGPFEYLSVWPKEALSLHVLCVLFWHSLFVHSLIFSPLLLDFISGTKLLHSTDNIVPFTPCKNLSQPFKLETLFLFLPAIFSSRSLNRIMKGKTKFTMFFKAETSPHQLHLNRDLAMICPQLLSICFRLKSLCDLLL